MKHGGCLFRKKKQTRATYCPLEFNYFIKITPNVPEVSLHFQFVCFCLRKFHEISKIFLLLLFNDAHTYSHNMYVLKTL